MILFHRIFSDIMIKTNKGTQLNKAIKKLTNSVLLMLKLRQI